MSRTALTDTLERRTLMAAAAAEYPSIDGTNNNLAHPTWGAVNTPLLRYTPYAYADGVSAPAGADRPSARVISNAISTQKLVDGDLKLDERFMTAFVYSWGQFIDHDISFSDAITDETAERFDIPVPAGDEHFDPAGTGTKVIRLTRSGYVAGTGTGPYNPREHFNEITAFLDGSVVYGSDPTRAAALRTFTGGRLKTSDGDLMPYNTEGFKNQNQSRIPNDQMFLAGDVRANENIELSSVHVLFLREHNRLAAEIAAANPSLSDEDIYQRARQKVAAQLQVITYNEFLPAVLGPKGLKPYKGYRPNVDPTISTEFSTAAYRFGHTMLGDDVEFMDDHAEEVREEVPLSGAFFNPALVKEAGIDPILKYLASDGAKFVDGQLVESVRNFLFGPPGAGGFDLASLNIQRGRDHGLADFNTTRAAFGLPRYTAFEQISSDPDVVTALRELYGSVDNIDLWIGGLVENHAPNASVGPTFGRIIADQFQRLRDGDRFWYRRVFSGRERRELESTRLSDVIKRNTALTNLQENVFLFNAGIAGNAWNDRNHDGRRSRGEKGARGHTVELLDEEGAVLASTTTDRKGRFSFTGIQEPGAFTVRCTPQGGWEQTGAATREARITRGETVGAVDFCVYPPTTAAAKQR